METGYPLEIKHKQIPSAIKKSLTFFLVFLLGYVVDVRWIMRLLWERTDMSPKTFHFTHLHVEADRGFRFLTVTISTQRQK